MIRAIIEDVVAFLWVAVLVVSLCGYIYLFSFLTARTCLLFSFGLAFSFLCTKMTVIVLWALGERLALSTEKTVSNWFSSVVVVFLKRFHGFADDLYVLPSLRRLHGFFSGRPTIDGTALFVGPLFIDALSLVTVGADSVLDVHTRLSCLDEDRVVGASRTIVIGERTVVQAGASVGVGTRIGDDVLVGPRAVIGRDCLIGNGAVIPPAAFLPDQTVVEEGQTWEG